jgi:hypothetical protein
MGLWTKSVDENHSAKDAEIWRRCELESFPVLSLHNRVQGFILPILHSGGRIAISGAGKPGQSADCLCPFAALGWRLFPEPLDELARIFTFQGEREMAHRFKVGDHVSWNSEAGRVRGRIKKKITSPVRFKNYMVRASEDEPQYLIKSDKTDHLAMHKGTALRKIASKSSASNNRSTRRKKK